MTNAHVVSPVMAMHHCHAGFLHEPEHHDLVTACDMTLHCTGGYLKLILDRLAHMLVQIMNATTVHVRRPGNPKKWRARVLCQGIICDLALLTVDEPEFWSEDLMSLQFVAVPELQVPPGQHPKRPRPKAIKAAPKRFIETVSSISNALH
jgi:hypothetical protein